MSKPEVKISTPVNFSTKGSLSWFFEALHWDSDDDLLFWAGVTQNGDYGADMYHLKVSTGLVTNLTKTGGLTRPFSKAGELRPNGAWISPNGKYYYFKKCDKQLFCSIGSLERSTLKYKDIMPGLVMGYSHRAAPEFLDAPAGKPELVFLEAAKKYSSTSDLYYFNQNKATVAKSLTSFSGKSELEGFHLNSSGTLIAFEMNPGKGWWDKYLLEVNIGGTPKLHKLTKSAGYNSWMTGFIDSDKALIWGHAKPPGYYIGDDYDKAELRISTTDGKVTKVIDPVKGFKSVLAIY